MTVLGRPDGPSAGRERQIATLVRAAPGRAFRDLGRRVRIRRRFPAWAEYGEEPFLWRGPDTYDPLVVYQPKTWLLREGWKKSGAISCRAVPSAAKQ
jgi:hypothetical protein